MQCYPLPSHFSQGNIIGKRYSVAEYSPARTEREIAMRRPVGVTVAAVILGIMAFFGAALMLLALVFSLFVHSPLIARALRPMVAAANALGLCFFLYCGWTVVDLFRVRRWARISVVVIGALMFLTSAVAAIGVLMVRPFVPLPPGTSPAQMSHVFFAIAAFYSLFCLVGLWWVVYFNLAHVRAAFSASRLIVTHPDILPPGGEAIFPSGAATSGWRIVIIVWAALLFCGVLGLPVVLLMHAPLFLFGATIAGPAEAGLVLLFVAVEIYTGIGLLRKWRAAWYVALLWQVYSVVYFLALLIPGVESRFVAYERQFMTQWSLAGTTPYSAPLIDLGPFMVLGMILGGVVVVVCTIALFARKEDYFGD